MAKCPICGAPMESRLCGYCGYAEKGEPGPASYANNNMPQQAVHEGTRQPQVIITNQYMPPLGIVPGVSRKKRTTALLLCIFLGEFGIHNFYVGKDGMGVLYLFTFGLFGIGWLVDIILIASGSFRDEFGLPLRD